MNRRTFLSALTGSLLAAPLDATAQQILEPEHSPTLDAISWLLQMRTSAMSGTATEGRTSERS